MDHLTKQQIVLLCLLVSFATAVATGITIFSMADNSTNPGVQQIAYRVIEKTISQVASDSPVRKIIPDVQQDTSTAPQALSISDIADKVSGSLVRIFKTAPGTTTQEFVTLAVMMGNNHLIAADATNAASTDNFVTILSDQKQYGVSFIKELGGGLAEFKLTDDTAAKKIPVTKTLSVAKLKIGFNVVAIGGVASSNIVSTGIIKQISTGQINGTNVNVFTTDFKPTTPTAALALVDTNGNLLGFYAPTVSTVGADEGSFMSVDDAVTLGK